MAYISTRPSQGEKGGFEGSTSVHCGDERIRIELRQKWEKDEGKKKRATKTKKKILDKNGNTSILGSGSGILFSRRGGGDPFFPPIHGTSFAGN